MVVKLIVCAVCSCLIGWIFGKNAKPKTDGVFKVDTRNDDRDLYLIEINIPMYEIPQHKILYLKVENANLQDSRQKQTL